MTSTGKVNACSLLRYTWRVCLVFATGLFLVASAEAATVPNQRLAFDHLTTGFALIGRHEFVSCETCHVGGVFKGTPKQCTGCHNGVIARGKSANHIPTTASCDSCHRISVSFAAKSALMNHSTITGACATCHNGTLAKGKNTTHVQTVADCGICHTTTTFDGGRFAHTPEQVGAKTCFDCHNGTTATGKGPTHIIINSANVCSACHQPNTGWRVKRVDHSQFNLVCSACHNGKISTGKGVNHIPTTQECSYCHTVTAWGPTGLERSPAKGVSTPNRNIRSPAK